MCRLGLATRGNTRLKTKDVEWAVTRGINYLNWCGHPDGLSRTVARMGAARRSVVVAAQFEARAARDAERELARMLEQLQTDYIDVLTLYYVESQGEWDVTIAPGGAWEFLAEQKRRLRIDVDEHFFDGGLIGRMLTDQCRNPLEDRAEPRWEIGIGSLDDAACDIGELMTGLVDHAEAGNTQTRVDAENSHEVRCRRSACDTTTNGPHSGRLGAVSRE